MLDRLDLDTDKPSDEELAKRFGYEDDYYSGGFAGTIRSCICCTTSGTVSWWMRLKPKIWSIFDEPYSSSTAKVK